MKLKRKEFSENLTNLILDLMEISDLGRDLRNHLKVIERPLSYDTQNSQTLEEMRIKLLRIQEKLDLIQRRIEDPKDYLQHLKYQRDENF